MILFKDKDNRYSEEDLNFILKNFNLEGKTVLCYSRLMSFGRIQGKNAVLAILDVIKKNIGPRGTLCLPGYTFSAYNNELFDPEKSKSATGVLSECARSIPGYIRTVHPVYSHVCWGENADQFNRRQNKKTCFGKDSFFELFSNSDKAYLLFLGTNYSAQTLYHYYEQTFGAPGRFLKSFKGLIKENGNEFELKFDSYVKNLAFYKKRMNSLARFDALAEELKFGLRHKFAADWILGIKEIDFKRLFKACLKVDQKYFLCSSHEQWETYYLNNKFSLFHHKLDCEKIRKVKEALMEY